MRKFRIIYVFITLLCCSCSDTLESERRAITMCVDLPEAFVEVKSDEKAQADAINGIPSTGLTASLWYSYKLGEYSNAPSQPQYIPSATEVTYTSSNRVPVKINNNSLLYPIDSDENYADTGNGKGNGNVYCVGFYPSDGWDFPNNENPWSSATHSINGSEDLMLADQMIGSYAKPFESQRFDHLLTWVKINMSTTSVGGSQVWGPVTSLKICSPYSTVTVTLSKEMEDDPKKEGPKQRTLEYSGDSEELDLNLQNTILNLTSKTFGQVFCSPPARAIMTDDGYKYVPDNYSEPQTAFGYIIKVVTEKIGEKEVFVELKNTVNVPVESSDAAIGNLYVITLHFQDIPVVEGVCTLKQWEDQNGDVYLDPLPTTDESNPEQNQE